MHPIPIQLNATVHKFAAETDAVRSAVTRAIILHKKPFQLTNQLAPTQTNVSFSNYNELNNTAKLMMRTNILSITCNIVPKITLK
jgi:hypothetical protein